MKGTTSSSASFLLDIFLRVGGNYFEWNYFEYDYRPCYLRFLAIRGSEQKTVHSKHELKLKFIFLLDIFWRVGEASYFESDYRLLRF